MAIRNPPSHSAWRRTAARCGLVLAFVLGPQADAGQPAWAVIGGDAPRGAELIHHFGCGGCHVVPGVAGAHGDVGPPLTRFGQRIYIAGMLRNTPSNLTRWLRDPQGVVPGNAMPDMGITEDQARDMAAYLYTLR
jgi:cytochrome c2